MPLTLYSRSYHGMTPYGVLSLDHLTSMRYPLFKLEFGGILVVPILDALTNPVLSSSRNREVDTEHGNVRS